MVNSREIAWDIYFANVLGIQYHPANPAHSRMSVADCARVADLALHERDKRCLYLEPSQVR